MTWRHVPKQWRTFNTCVQLLLSRYYIIDSMKKAIISVLVIVGIGGIIFLATRSAHPADTSRPLSASNASSQTPSGGDSSSGSSVAGSAVTYKDGTYTGSTARTTYGPVQVKVTVSGGKINAVDFLQTPTDERESQEINSEAKPLLVKAVLSAQSSHFDFVSGATTTSEGAQQSLESALSQAA